MSPGLAILAALAALVLGFGLLYLLARRIDNYGIVDIAWSYAFGGAALLERAAGPLVQRFDDGGGRGTLGFGGDTAVLAIH